MPDEGAEQHRVGRGERRAEDGGRGGVEAEQQPGGERRERGGKQRPGPQDQCRETALLADLADVHADGVGEQHQHEAEGGDDLERRGVEGEVDQAEPRGAECRAEQQEDGDLRQAGALDRAGHERGEDDDDAHQGEEGGEAFVGHGGKHGRGLAFGASGGHGTLQRAAGLTGLRPPGSPRLLLCPEVEQVAGPERQRDNCSKSRIARRDVPPTGESDETG